MARPRKGSEPNWGAIKVFYLNDHSAKECALKFGLSSRSIEVRATKEGWRAQLHQNIEEAQAKLRTGEELAEQAASIGAMVGLGDKLRQELANDTSGIRNRIECFARLCEAHDKLVKSGRLVAGIKDGEPSILTDDVDEPGKKYIVAIEPQKSA